MATFVKNKRYLVLRDTREQVGWEFPEDTHFCAGTEKATLKTGDYTLAGYEDILSIERKRNTSEWAMNIFQKRFDRELARLSLYKYAYVILEFTLQDITDFPANSGIPAYMWTRLRTTPQLMLKKTIEMMQKFPTVHFIFAGDKGRYFASSLFKRVCESNVQTKD